MIRTKPVAPREHLAPKRQAEFKQPVAKKVVDLTLPDQSIDITDLDGFQFDDKMADLLNVGLEAPTP